MSRRQGRPDADADSGAGTTGTLHVVATPLGNLEDLSPRALRVLREVPVIACEDTRTAGMLLHHLGISREGRRLVPYHDANEARQVAVLMRTLAEGTDVALISEAGTPLISDPGYRVVAAARAAGIRVVPVPGPCAAIAALSVSGLPTDRFCFLGFLPAKPGRRRAVIEALSPEQGTCICYVPARTVGKVLQDFRDLHPDWTLVIAREMTKMFEEFLAGGAADLLERWEDSRARGEVTLLAAPPSRRVVGA
ncbi:16S rRNA (cytidine(1402)-2'-O)-methyltransferase [Myxococcota bacterium]|nr:16S rRNA (cytidine(1402)-2'-O)-methyltransferase [Myxococcota bacterium]